MDAKISAESTVESSNKKSYSDYRYAKGCFDRLIGAFSDIEEETKRERDVRYLKNVESSELRKAGILKADELYTPNHLIDSNIRAEQPSFIQYLTQSRRSLIFSSPDGVTVDGLDKLESDFTNKARYLGWEIPFVRVFDGGPAHGWDAVEIIFDADKPGGFCIEHIGHDSLIFATDSEDIEAQEILLRRINLTSKQLREFAETNGFDGDVVDKLINKSGKGEYGDECSHSVYKTWYKEDGVCYVCWFAPAAEDYLKTPEKLFMGRRNFTTAPEPELDSEEQPIIDPETQQPLMDFPQLDETKFPVVIYRYTESSDPKITETRGRIKLDEPAQEAASAIQSGLVNGILKASNVYASPANIAQNQAPNEGPKLTKVVLSPGGVYDQPMIFFHTSYPDPAVIQALQTVITLNKQEQSQINFSVLNRKDSGKTATEVASANQKATELTSVQVIMVSIFIRQVYGRCWNIYQNRVLQGKITIKDVTLLPFFGEGIKLDPIDGSVAGATKPRKYILKSSGDVDVIQRQEKANKQMQAWPVIQNQPALAQLFLQDIIRSQFPEDAERYIAAMNQAKVDEVTQLKGLVGQLGNVLKALVLGPDGQIKPEYAQQAGQLQQLEANVQQTLSQGSQGGPNDGDGDEAQANSQPQPPQPTA